MIVQFWISVILISIGLIFILIEWIFGFATRHKDEGFSFTPFVYGLMLFVGVLLLPIELPIPRLLAAFLAMCLDATISVMFPTLIIILIRDKIRDRK